jgi:hypothetical protein
MKLSAEARGLRKRLLGTYDFGDDPAGLTLLDELVLPSTSSGVCRRGLPRTA